MTLTVAQATKEQKYALRKEREDAKRKRKRDREDRRFQDMLSLEMEKLELRTSEI